MSQEKPGAKSGSKFSGLLAAARPREDTGQTDGQGAAVPANTPEEGTRRRGRPRGKRSDPDFEQVTAYIRSRTHREVKIALLREAEGREFSELVEELLADWIKSRT